MHGGDEGEIPAVHIRVIRPLAKAVAQEFLDGAVPADVHQRDTLAGEESLLFEIAPQPLARDFANGADARLHAFVGEKSEKTGVAPVVQGFGKIGETLLACKIGKILHRQPEGF